MEHRRCSMYDFKTRSLSMLPHSLALRRNYSVPACTPQVAQGVTSQSWLPSWQTLPPQEVGVRTATSISADLAAGVSLLLWLWWCCWKGLLPTHRVPSPGGSRPLPPRNCISGTSSSGFWRWPKLLVIVSFPRGTKIVFCFVSVQSISPGQDPLSRLFFTEPSSVFHTHKYSLTTNW